MTVSREELAAFADGELDAGRAAEVAALVDADPGLARQVAAHRALKAQLSAHFAPILDQPVPERLTALLTPADRQVIDFAAESRVIDFAAERGVIDFAAERGVIDFAAERGRRAKRRGLPRWSYFAAPAMAAALALALFIPRGGGNSPMGDYANTQLASALDSQLAAQQGGGAATRILISFQNRKGEYCRAFSDPAQSGIACRDPSGWRLADLGPGAVAGGASYRQAGSDFAGLMAKAQDMAAGPALDASAEQAARARDWLPATTRR